MQMNITFKCIAINTTIYNLSLNSEIMQPNQGTNNIDVYKDWVICNVVNQGRQPKRKSVGTLLRIDFFGI